ncbi:MAG: class II aldolase/adducin family protein [Bacteroidales bacterium]|jgi:L-fuculose-phosphate aldolase|nr:class II aldolase/adducin family protein [Bacteroidales bacterium]
MEHKYKAERKEVARFMRRLYRQGLTTTSGGNISIRVSDDNIVITPSATDKGNMKWKEVGVMSLPGENLTPDLKPSIEYALHINIYKKNKDINAIVHAHPVFASSFTAMKLTINTSLTAEARAICGEPRFVPYAIMGSAELADIAAQNATDADILLLENHGILTTGTSVLSAFDKLEVLENAARMTLITEITGKKKILSPSRLREIDRLFR